MDGSSRQRVVAVVMGVVTATLIAACAANPFTSPAAAPRTEPSANVTPPAYRSTVVWAARNLLGWRCSLADPATYQDRNPQWELTNVLADYDELGPPNPAGKYRLSMDGELTLNGRVLPLPAGTSNSTTVTIDDRAIRFTSRPTGDGVDWRTLAPEPQEASVSDVARYKLRLADYDLLEQVRYRCLTGNGATSGELTQRTPNAAPALEVVRPDGVRIPLISVGGF